VHLAVACGANQPEVPAPAARWLADFRVRPAVVKASALPHAAVTAIAAQASRWLGPTASAVVRWCAGAIAKSADDGVAIALQRPLRARAHPGLLVPHPHVVAVLAADMRGFSHLTRALRDTQYLANLVGEYLTELTRVAEGHRGVIFQYTGDGLLALFLPELSGMTGGEMLDRLVHQTAAEMQDVFATLHARWGTEWRARGREVEVGLGLGLSFGPATIGFLGPAGKKQFGVIGEPVNLAAFLCSQAHAGSLLVDLDSFARAETEPPDARVVRLRAKKKHHRIRAVCLRHGTLTPRPGWLAGASAPG
jgi:class 3 adenylate cyclase